LRRDLALYDKRRQFSHGPAAHQTFSLCDSAFKNEILDFKRCPE
jgi:hypothetical protein